MIRFVSGNFSQADWERLASRSSAHNLMQSWAYGEAKRLSGGWGVERGVLQDGETVVGVAQAAIRRLPVLGSVVGGGLCWINRGPLLFDDRARDESLAALRDHFASKGSYYLRIAPAWTEPVRGRDFRDTGTSGWASATVSLAPDIAAIRKSLRRNWRSHLNKSERAGITVECRDDEAWFRDFLEEYSGFMQQRAFETTVTAPLLDALYGTTGPTGAVRCYRGRIGDTPVGSVLTVRYGDTVEYLVGTLLDAGRPVSAGQFLVWHALCRAREEGAARFDVGGMDPALTPKGIYEFKEGLGGEPYRLANEIEAAGGGLRAALVRWRVAGARQAAS